MDVTGQFVEFEDLRFISFKIDNEQKGQAIFAKIVYFFKKLIVLNHIQALPLQR